MVLSKAASVAAFGAITVTLHGCGGGDGGGGGGSGDEPKEPTTTTTTNVCASIAPAPDAGSGLEGELVNDLNRRYMGYNKSDPMSPIGVTIRVMGPEMDAAFFCGTKCYNGYPDCRVSASLYNNRMLVMHDNYQVKVTMNRLVGIIYNQTTIENNLAKCGYMYDAATWGRVNHGCGCAEKQKGCGQQDGAYGNQDCEYEHAGMSGIKPETCHNNTEKSPMVDSCSCKSSKRDKDTPAPVDQTTETQQCFFNGGALYPPNGVFKNELREMFEARLQNQVNPATEKLASGVTRHKVEYWNEVIVEAEELRNRLIENPLHAYAAFMYIKGNPDGKKKAQQMQQQIQREWGEPAVPIVEMDPEVDTRCTAPFRLKSDMPSTTMFTTTTSWDGQDCAENYSQCGGKDWKGPTCCQHDWECSRADDFYSGCTAPSSGPLDIEV